MNNYIFKLVEIERKDGTSHQKEDWKDVLYAYPEFLKIGYGAEIPMDNYKYLRTSRVIDFELNGTYMIIETKNSKYTFRR